MMIYDVFYHSHGELIKVHLVDHIFRYDNGTILINSAIRLF